MGEMSDLLSQVFGLGTAFGCVLWVCRSMVNSRRQIKAERIRQERSWGKIKRHHSSYDDDYEVDDEDDDSDYELRERERVLKAQLRSVREQLKR